MGDGRVCEVHTSGEAAIAIGSSELIISIKQIGQLPQLGIAADGHRLHNRLVKKTTV